jgi:hypothetical protein
LEVDSNLEAREPEEGARIPEVLEAEEPKEGTIPTIPTIPTISIPRESLEVAAEPRLGNIQDEKGLEDGSPVDLAEAKTPEQTSGKPDRMVDVPSRKSRRIRKLTAKAEQIK